jgi:photosystem II stability/assembly factor-like uncharacterized protein
MKTYVFPICMITVMLVALTNGARAERSFTSASLSFVGVVPDRFLSTSLQVDGRIFAADDGAVLVWTEGGTGPGNPTPYSSRSPELSRPLNGTDGLRPWMSANGPCGGYVTGLVVSPTEPSTIFAGTQAGGVYRSTNGGITWRPARDGIVCDWVKQIDVSPLSPDLVCAASSAYWKGNEGDVYLSTDGGETWSSAGLEGTWWSAAYASRTDPQRILAGGELGIYLSTDGGGSWSYRSGTSSALEFAADPSDPQTMYAGSYGYYFYRSTNDGDTWTQIGTSIPNGNIRAVSVDAGDSQVIYCAAYSSLGGGSEGIYRSTDYGVTWGHVLVENTWDVRADPAVPGVLWAAGDGEPFTATPGLWKSVDMGSTWTEIDLPADHYSAPFAFCVDVNPAETGEVFVGLYRAGVMKTTDGGGSWGEANAGLASDFVNCIAVHPSEPATVYAGTFQADLWKTTDGGANWSWSADGFFELNHAVNDVIVDPNDPQVLYLGGSNSGVFKSTDAGTSWNLTALANYSEVRVIDVSPHNSQEVWAGVSNSSATLGLWKSTDGGNFWSNKLPGTAGYSVAVSPADPDVVYAGTGTWWLEPAFIFVSLDGGQTWLERYDDGFGAITSLSVDPTNPLNVYAASIYNNIVKSTNGGQTWTPNYGGFDPGGRIFTVVADPLRLNTVYAAVDDNVGFYVSFNGGNAWHAYNPGLWLKSLVPLVANPLANFRIFYTGTMGSGFYYNFVTMP